MVKPINTRYSYGSIFMLLTYKHFVENFQKGGLGSPDILERIVNSEVGLCFLLTRLAT